MNAEEVQESIWDKETQLARVVMEHVLKPIFDNYDELDIESEEEFKRVGRFIFKHHCTVLWKAFYEMYADTYDEHPEIFEGNAPCDPEMKRKWDILFEMWKYLGGEVIPRAKQA